MLEGRDPVATGAVNSVARISLCKQNCNGTAFVKEHKQKGWPRRSLLPQDILRWASEIVKDYLRNNRCLFLNEAECFFGVIKKKKSEKP